MGCFYASLVLKGVTQAQAGAARPDFASPTCPSRSDVRNDGLANDDPFDPSLRDSNESKSTVTVD